MNKERGFTLVELLIVIVVIGILAAMMMFSSTEAVTSAKASNIISNMNNLKKAVLSWYADNKRGVRTQENEGSTYRFYDADGTDRDKFEGFARSSYSSKILKYMNNSNSIKLANHGEKIENGEYCYSNADGKKKKANIWYVGYMFNNGEERIKEKVAGRAVSLGLVGGGDGKSWSGSRPTKDKTFTADDKIVWMHIITLGE